MKTLNNFSQIQYDSPVEAIIKQIRELIASGQLKPGDRLPAERVLSERLGVGRSHVREAIRKLEFYGVLKTKPQNGTIVAGLGLPALQVLITDMLNLQGSDFKSLVESRVILEINIAKLAAEHRTEEDIEELKEALKIHKGKLLAGEDAVEEDFLFHLKIADASKNTVLKSLMMIITPDIVEYFRKHDVCGEAKAQDVVAQHEELLEAIIAGDPQRAGAALEEHLREIKEYAQNQLDNILVLNGPKK